MTILVTGGAGFIGSHTCVQLLNSGMNVVVVDNLCNSKEIVLDRVKKITGKDFPFYKEDILDEAAIDKIFKAHKIDAVIHFAALKAVGESIHMPLEYYSNNITGVLRLLKVMRDNDVKKIVFSSSATVYGMDPHPPCKETDAVSATNPYGRTKLHIEQILTDLWVSDNEWSISLLRYFNPIGAHESGLIGEDPNGIPNNVGPYIAQVAVGRLPMLRIFGNDYETPDGTGVRDYIHVCDLAAGHLCAVDWVRKNKGVDIVNLGTGSGCSVLELVKSMEKASGKEIKYEFGPRREGDIATICADCSKAKKVFGWEAKYDIQRMCDDLWRFIEQNPKGITE